MSLQPDKRNNLYLLFRYNIAYNIGRLSSYMLAGLIIGFLGQAVVSAIPEVGVIIMRASLMIFVIILGFYVSGLIPRLAFIEKLGQPIWSKLQPIGLKYMPINRLHHAYLFGFIWGWLPCGLVYYALLASFTQSNPIDSALFMLAFGMGTLIPVLLTGMLLGKLTTLKYFKRIKQISGILLIAMGCIGLLISLFPNIGHNLHYLMPQTIG